MGVRFLPQGCASLCIVVVVATGILVMQFPPLPISRHHATKVGGSEKMHGKVERGEEEMYWERVEEIYEVERKN